MNNDPALPRAVSVIAAFESFRGKAYDDGFGKYTIGYGCTYYPNGQRVVASDGPITEPAAMEWLRTMVAAVMVRVRMMVHVPITDNQCAALTSLSYNCGTGAIGNSTLMRLLNTGETAHAADQFDAWVYDGGRVVPGLVNRRRAEKALFLAPDGVEPLPLPVTRLKPPAAPEQLSEADKLNDLQLQRTV